jgi:PHP domain
MIEYDPSRHFFSRRVFLLRSAGLVLTLGAPPLAIRRVPIDTGYHGGVWLGGDHHIHTKFSPDGQYAIEEQVRHAAQFGLGWCVITDHGSAHHDRVALGPAYAALQEARRQNPGILVFQGMEWNMPAAEHASVIVPPGPDEARVVADFEALYDERNEALPDLPKDTEADAIAGLKSLERLSPPPLVFANHPARRGLDSPHELRAWSEAAPHVFRGFEGAPGHQAGALTGGHRGAYYQKPPAAAFAGFPAETYASYGGYDWMTAKVGGMWDALLGEGRTWYITADSDSHRHYTDRTVVDASAFDTQGSVTVTDRKVERSQNLDFYPGEYTQTIAYAADRTHAAVMDALRSGCMFTVHGGLIDRLELSAHAGGAPVRMGGTLRRPTAGGPVTFTVRIGVPDRPNHAGRRPRLDHVDVIVGRITGPARDRDEMANPTTRVAHRLTAQDWRRVAPAMVGVELTLREPGDFYVRLRGTNRDVPAPAADPPGLDPWEDLWFYSNPIFVRER